jgi:hypothetical protein
MRCWGCNPWPRACWTSTLPATFQPCVLTQDSTVQTLNTCPSPFWGVGLVLEAVPCILALLRPQCHYQQSFYLPRGVRGGHSLVKLMTSLIPSPLRCHPCCLLFLDSPRWTTLIRAWSCELTSPCCGKTDSRALSCPTWGPRGGGVAHSILVPFVQTAVPGSGSQCLAGC